MKLSLNPPAREVTVLTEAFNSWQPPQNMTWLACHYVPTNEKGLASLDEEPK